MGHTESSPANSFKISTDSSLYAAACRRLLLIWAKKSLLSCCPNKHGDHCGLTRNEQGEIRPYTMTFLHAGNTMKHMETFETHPILVKLLLQVDQGQQGSKPGYCMPWQCQWYPLVRQRHGISLQKSPCSHSLRIFQDTPGTYPRYSSNSLCLGSPFLLGCLGMPGVCWN